jgi:hypothetical protein
MSDGTPGRRPLLRIARRFSMRDFDTLIRDTYLEALEYGGDPDEALETALNLVNEAEPELERDDACRLAAEIVAGHPSAVTARKALPPRRSLA